MCGLMNGVGGWADGWGGGGGGGAGGGGGGGGGRCVLCTPACSVYVCPVCLVQVSEEAIVTFATGASRTQIKVGPM